MVQWPNEGLCLQRLLGPGQSCWARPHSCPQRNPSLHMVGTTLPSDCPSVKAADLHSLLRGVGTCSVDVTLF